MSIDRLLSYADALTAAIRRQRTIRIDGLQFTWRADIEIPTDHASTGRHTLVFELAETGKQYRVMIEPIPETHRAPVLHRARELLAELVADLPGGPSPYDRDLAERADALLRKPLTKEIEI
jgi:hypothetical protein